MNESLMDHNLIEYLLTLMELPDNNSLDTDYLDRKSVV